MHLLKAIEARKPRFEATLEKARSITETLFQQTAPPAEPSQGASQPIPPPPLGGVFSPPFGTGSGEATLGPQSLPTTIDPKLLTLN